MEKLLEKIDVYDIIGLFLSGSIISSITLFICKYYELNYFDFKQYNINITFLFIMTSYFVGLFFQEISSFIYKHFIYPNNKLLKKSLYPKNDDYYHLSNEEKNNY